MPIFSLSSAAALLQTAPVSEVPADLGEEVIPLWAVFLIFFSIVLIFGGFYARQHRRAEPGGGRRQDSPRRARKQVEESATPILIDVREPEPAEELQINLEDQPEVRTD
jgi:hypothetical protein